MHWFILIALWALIGFALLDIFWAGDFYFIWYSLGIIFLALGIYIEKRNINKKANEKKRKLDEDEKKKLFLLEKYEAPIDCPTYKYLSGHDNISSESIVNAWIGDKNLNLLVDGENIEKHKILIENISFYAVKGDIRQETEIIGGNATLGETVAAEALLGTAAAIKKNQAIQNLKTIDERKTIISATIDGESKFIFFRGAELYNYLLERIPEKEQSFVAMNKG